LTAIWGLPAYAADSGNDANPPPETPSAAGECGARPLSDPAPWEETLPITDVTSELAADDEQCVREIDRTANAVVWANPDGTTTARQYAGDVNYQAEDGSWQAIDTRLVDDGQGGKVNKAGPFSVRFAGHANDEELLQLEADAGSLSLTFEGATRTDETQLEIPDDSVGNVADSADSDTLTYANVLDGVDLQYQVLPNTVKEAFVLDGPLPPGVSPEFSFSVNLTGLDARTTEDGTIEFVNSASGEVAFWVPAGVAVDSSGNPDEGVDPAIAPVTNELVEGESDSSVQLVVSVDDQWLNDPARVFPVTIDPTFTSKTNIDAYVSDGSPNTNYNGAAQYNSGAGQYWDRVGTASGTEYRTFLTYPSVSWLSNYLVTAASWSGYAYSIGGGSTVNVHLKPVSSSWLAGYVTWNTQPSVRTAYQEDVSYTAGSQWQSVSILSWVNNWKGGTWGQYGIRLDGPASKYANLAAHESPASVQSYLTITYDGPPTVSRPLSGGQYVDSKVSDSTPTLSVQVDDADTPTAWGYFELWNTAHTSMLQSGNGPTVKVGERSSKTLSTLSDGTYHWRARAQYGFWYSPWTPWQTLTVDTAAPAAPSVSGLPTINTWSSGTSVTPTFNQSPSEAHGFLWGVDIGSDPPDLQLASGGSSGSPGSVPLTSGWHDLAVRTVDSAGNLSSVTHHTFGLGDGGFQKPQESFKTQSGVEADVLSDPSYDGIALQWRRSESATWQNVPTGDVTYQSSGSGIGSWPVTETPGTNSTDFPSLIWDVASTASGVDGPLQARIAFYTSGVVQTYLDDASIRTGTLDKFAFGGNYGSAPAGPGSVNLLTGDLSLSSADAEGPAGAVSRTFQSLAPNASGSVFGPGWTSNLLVADSQYRELVDNGDTVQVVKADGSELGFRLQPGGDYAAPDGSPDLTLSKVSASRFELAALTAQTYGFTNYDSGATADFRPSDVTDATGHTSSVTWTVDAGSGLTRPVRMEAAPPAGVNCSSSPLTTRGCRTLTFDYSTSTTATGTAPGDWGEFEGQLKTVSYTAWDPQLSTPAMRTVDVSSYLYDDDGRLRAAWDPRISPPLKTTYDYDADGHISSVAPPGEEGWEFDYAPLGGEPSGTGRLDTVSRASLPSGIATMAFRYQIPLTTAGGGPYNLDASTVAKWAQQDVPTNATAVFPPDQTPSGSPPSSYTRARVFYMNIQGQQVNAAEPGGYITTSEHDGSGRVTRELTAGNRQRALDSSSSTEEQAAMSKLLDSQTVFDSTGIRVTDTYGPAHVVDLPDGTTRQARLHVHNIYDENAPSGGTYNLVTTTTASALPTDGTAEQHTRTTTNAYAISGDSTGWTVGKPLRVTVDPGSSPHLNLQTTTLYDAGTGNLTARRLPATPSGGDAHETLFLAYTAGTHPSDSACGNRPEWAELACKQLPAAQPGTSGLPDLPITQITDYDLYQKPLETIDTNGSDTRTATITYDDAGRETTHAISSNVGTSLPTITTDYDDDSGRVSTTSDGTLTITRTYDTLGRLTDYEDADGNVSEYSYDLLDRVSTVNDGKATTTYTYDQGSEKRGLPTTISDAGAGTFSATYDADGNLSSQTYPGSITATYTYNENGQATDLVYSKATGTWPASPTTYNIHGERTTASNTLEAFTYTYDAAGRLTEATDAQASTCIKRQYAFDADTNRTQLTGTTTGGAGNPDPCLDTGGTTATTNYTYDAADRITGTGYSYDSYGRTTGVPAAHSLSASSTALSYYANDRVRTMATGGTTVTYNLDPAGRVRDWSSTADSQTRSHHYAADTDVAAWTSENTAGTTWTRNVTGFNGAAAVVTNTGSVTLQIVNLHGDAFSSISTAASDWISSHSWTATDEYGKPSIGAPSTGTRYDYLGQHQRQRDTNSGLQLMGQRVLNPVTGRFLQTDPLTGGGCNDYEYTCGNPANRADLDGRVWRYLTTTWSGWLGQPLTTYCTGADLIKICQVSWFGFTTEFWQWYDYGPNRAPLYVRRPLAVGYYWWSEIRAQVTHYVTHMEVRYSGRYCTRTRVCWREAGRSGWGLAYPLRRDAPVYVAWGAWRNTGYGWALIASGGNQFNYWFR
jgi:RHS repeat-associated protein